MKKIRYLLLASCLLLQYCPLDSLAQDHGIKKTRPRKPAKKPVIKYGIASYYAKKFKNRKTSDGSSYISTSLTAACNVVPLGSWVKVTNLKNNKYVIVQVNDHLHRKNYRLIDLSRSAAEKLGFISRGVARVRMEVLTRPKQRRTNR